MLFLDRLAGKTGASCWIYRPKQPGAAVNHAQMQAKLAASVSAPRRLKVDGIFSGLRNAFGIWANDPNLIHYFALRAMASGRNTIMLRLTPDFKMDAFLTELRAGFDEQLTAGNELRELTKRHTPLAFVLYVDAGASLNTESRDLCGWVRSLFMEDVKVGLYHSHDEMEVFRKGILTAEGKFRPEYQLDYDRRFLCEIWDRLEPPGAD